MFHGDWTYGDSMVCSEILAELGKILKAIQAVLERRGTTVKKESFGRQEPE